MDWSGFYWFPGKAGSRIRDQLKIYQINYPYVTQGFLEKPDQGSWFLIRLFQETGCYRRKQIKWWVIFARYFGLQHTRFYWSRSTKDPADPHWFVLVVLPSQESPWGSLGSSDGSWESPRVLKEVCLQAIWTTIPNWNSLIHSDKRLVLKSAGCEPFIGSRFIFYQLGRQILTLPTSFPRFSPTRLAPHPGNEVVTLHAHCRDWPLTDGSPQNCRHSKSFPVACRGETFLVWAGFSHACSSHSARRWTLCSQDIRLVVPGPSSLLFSTLLFITLLKFFFHFFS